MFPFIGIFILLLQLSSGVEIPSIRSVPDEIAVSAGSRLLIPCRFFSNRPNRNCNIQMEWGMIPDNGGDYRPLISTNAARVKHHDQRARIFPSLMGTGNCSLVVGPVTIDDGGFYEVHLRSDGKEYKPIPIIYVNVSDGSGASPVTMESQTEDKSQQGKDSQAFKPGSRAMEVITIPDVFHRSKQKRVLEQTVYQIVAAVVTALVLLAAIGLAIYMLRALKKDILDEMVSLEEGRGSTEASPDASTPSSESSSTTSASQDSSDSSVTSLPNASQDSSAASVIPTASDTSVPSAVCIQLPTPAASGAPLSVVTHIASATSVPPGSLVKPSSWAPSEPSVGIPAVPSTSAASVPSEGPAASLAAVMPRSCPSGSITITVPPELAGTKSPVTVILHVPTAREGHDDARTCRASTYNITLLSSPASSASSISKHP